MPVKSAPYYWVECDGCGERCDYDDYSAWDNAEQAADITTEYEWTRDGDRFHCSSCPPLDVNDG